jgi:hypothetical protein
MLLHVHASQSIYICFSVITSLHMCSIICQRGIGLFRGKYNSYFLSLIYIYDAYDYLCSIQVIFLQHTSLYHEGV